MTPIKEATYRLRAASTLAIVMSEANARMEN